jgi:hypothetical protein
MSHCRYTIFPQEYTPSRRLQTPSITYLSMFFTVPILFVFECIGFRYLRSNAHSLILTINILYIYNASIE